MMAMARRDRDGCRQQEGMAEREINRWLDGALAVVGLVSDLAEMG